MWVTFDAYTLCGCLKVGLTPAAGRFNFITLSLMLAFDGVSGREHVILGEHFSAGQMIM